MPKPPDATRAESFGFAPEASASLRSGRSSASPPSSPTPRHEAESVKRYRELFENVPIGIYRTTPGGRILMANHTLVSMLGFESFDELAALDLEAEARRNDYPRAEVKERLKRDGEIRGLETLWRRRDGSVVYLRENSKAIRGERGEVLFYEGTLEDVSERKRAEEAMRRGERKYRLLMEQASDGIFVFDFAGNILEVNPRAAEMSGYAEDELLALKIFDLFPEAEVSANPIRFHELAEGKALLTERRARRKDDTTLDVEISARAVEDGRVQAIVRDITERKRGVESLSLSQRQYESLVNTIDGIVWEADADSLGFTFVSRQVERVLGYTVEQWLSEPSFWRNHLLPEDREWVVDFCANAAEAVAASAAASATSSSSPSGAGDGESGTFECEYRMLRADGAVVWLRDMVTVVAERGQPVSLRGIMVDITVRKEAEEASKQSEERYRDLFENAGDIHYTHDLEGNYTTVNKAGERITGYTREELLGMNVTHLVTSEHLDLARRMLVDKVKSEGPPVYEIEIVTKAGRRVPLEVSIRLMRDAGGRRVGVQGTARDITERKRAEEALRESEERYALAARGANDGLWDWDFKNHRIYFSPRWKSMLGYSEGEVGHRPEEWFALIHPDDAARVKEEIYEHLEGSTGHFQNEHRVLHKDGTYRWMLARGLAVTDAATGAVSRIAGSQTDITHGKRVEEQLIHEALHDVLTGLPNRALFMDHLTLVIDQSARREDYLFAVLFLDIDSFKIVNDSLGHVAGDTLLKEISGRLKNCLRPGDTVARLGGDEFTILLHDMNDAADAERVAERIHRELARPFQVVGVEMFTTASIGIALSANGFDGPEDFLRAADTAMYRAKARGRACHEVFDQLMHAEVKSRLQLETDLRRAVRRGEMRVYYQPIVSLKDGRVTGFEALVRWQHPVRGLVLPAHFIPLAEDTGLIVPVGLWVLEEACRQTLRWQEIFDNSEQKLFVSVNLSGRQFAQADLIPSIAGVLRDTKFDPTCLRLEITESVIMEHAESTAEMLHQLRALGVQLTIDDFGTGYSSLSYLQRFPINALKVDRSFVSRMCETEENSEIVRTIVTLARNLGMDVVAEGVETAEQAARLRALDCEFVQGNFFSGALNAALIEQLLSVQPEGIARKLRESLNVLQEL